jgi:vitamin B12 transporter
MGYYLQHQFKNEQFDTQFGVRLEDNERFGDHTVGQAAIRYHFLPNVSVYANIGSAFRAPTLNEMYSQWGGNIDLKPEESTSYEIGADYQLNQNLLANVSLYQNEVKNLISSQCIATCDGDWVTTFPVYQNLNVDKATFKGGELGLKWQQNDYFISTQYAYVKTENKETGLEIAYRPKNTVTLTTGLENSIYGINISAIARSKSNASNTANPIQVPGYATMDFNAFWNINPNVKVFTNIQNLWDNQYHEVSRSATDWYINGGRQASAGVTFRY